MKVAVASFIAGSRKMSSWFRLPGAYLLTPVMRMIINRWRRMTVSTDVRHQVSGQFKENVLGFRLQNRAGVSIALAPCYEHDRNSSVHRWKKYCQVSIELKSLCQEVL